MADEIDNAQHQIEQTMNIILQAARNRAETLKHNGLCYNCAQPLTNGAFCDKDCSDDYHRLQAANKRNGLI